MPVTELDIRVLAQTVWGEARGEPAEGRIAVAHVVLNRLRSRKWFGGRSVTEVCMRPWQFSCWNESDPNFRSMHFLTLDQEPFQDAYLAALAAIRGYTPDPTGGATHYHATSIKPPAWARGQTPCATIGRHVFFKGID